MKIIKKIYNKFIDNAYFSQRVSYSQSGEDLIVSFLLRSVLKVETPTYFDIGAHHPYAFNNTYLFYTQGSTGINIEPDPSLFKYIAKKRPRDININAGIGFDPLEETANFYIMSSRELNTFSRVEAERVCKMGAACILEIAKIKLINVNNILSKYFSETSLDFLSIDVEGWDFEILSNIQLSTYRPKVICVETIIYDVSGRIVKRHETIDFLLKNNYLIYADTSINTIFVRDDLILN